MEKEKKSNRSRVYTIIGTILCILLVPILIVNLTLIIRSYTNQDEVPSIGGYSPMIVLSDSMYPMIESGDLAIIHQINVNEIKRNDVITFFDPSGNNRSVVTHRVIDIVKEDNKLSFKTKGDNNNAIDPELVEANKVIGIYRTRIPKAGNVAMFMQSPLGLVICVVMPILLFVGYDVVSTRRYEKKKQETHDALVAELERLKAEKGNQNEGQDLFDDEE